MELRDMENLKLNNDKELTGHIKSLKDYIFLIRINLKPFFIIVALILVLAGLYAGLAPDIYQSTATIKINKKESLIEQPNSSIEVKALERFVTNEIEILENYDTRERTALALIDSFNNAKDKSLFSLVKEKNSNNHKSLKDIIALLKSHISIEQKTGTDLIEISAESQSPYEAALIVNSFATEYKFLNLEDNRGELTTIRMFLEKQSNEKLNELRMLEDSLKIFQQRGRIVSLDAQSAALINQLSQLDVQRNSIKIDLMSSNEVLHQYKEQIGKQNPQLAGYLEGKTSQAYIDILQKQIAELQMNRDLALANRNSNIDVTAKVNEYNQRIAELKDKLSALISEIKTDAFASSPEQVRDLSQKLVETDINNRSLAIKLGEIESVINKYERDFSRLPKASIELAQYQRKRDSYQQLYLLVEQKYQQAMIDELSQPGNIALISMGRVAEEPTKPIRWLIILIAILLGPSLAFAYLLLKDYIDDTIKSPDDIEKQSVNLLTWIPTFVKNGTPDHEFVVVAKPDSPTSEAFRTLRARMQFSNIGSDGAKKVLITSAAEHEGKTVVALNLAGNFAQSKKKTLLIDCDLRRPRIHTIMKGTKSPGLVDYLFNSAKLEDIIKKSSIKDLYYIPAGTTPSSPAEVLGSKSMELFLQKIESMYDVIVIDSPPIVAVVDSEVLARMVDGTIMVVASEKTETKLMLNAVNLFRRNNAKLLGIVLNNFNYKSGYKNYFKYYYKYSES